MPLSSFPVFLHTNYTNHAIVKILVKFGETHGLLGFMGFFVCAKHILRD